MKIPEINKQSFTKVLRELDLGEFPSLKNNSYLLDLKNKLIRKEPLLVVEKLLGFARFNQYLNDCRKELNKYYVDNLDFSRFKNRPPKEFQEEGARWLLKNDRCILADDQGLGKTIQVIMAALSLDEDYKILVVTKKTLKYNFEKELSYYSDSYKVIEKEWETGFKFTIIHYDSLKKYIPNILEERFQVVIADECFAYNTLINTDKGLIKIGDIVEKKLNVQTVLHIKFSERINI